MDLNQLLYHHQMALMAANRAHRDGHPASNFDLPRYYAKRISEYRARRGIGVGPAPMADREGSNPRSGPPTSGQRNSYPLFLGDTLVAELLVNRALAMTEAERNACALDGIAERLADLHEALWVIGPISIRPSILMKKNSRCWLLTCLRLPPTRGRRCICGRYPRSRMKVSPTAMSSSSA